MGPRPHAVAGARRPSNAASANRQALVAVLGCIVFACAAILMISRTGEQGESRLSGGGLGGRGGGHREADGATARPSSINGEVTSRIAGAIAARKRRREEERPQRLAEAAAAAATAGPAVGAGGDQEEEEEGVDEACAARPGPSQLQLPDLGFDYPELRALKRRLRRALACAAGCPLSSVRRAYASAVDEALSSAAGGGYAAGAGGLLAAYRSAPLAEQKNASPASSSCAEAAAGRELAAFVRGALAALLLDGGEGGGDGGRDQQQQQQQQATSTSGPLPLSALEQLAPCPPADLTLPKFPRGARLLLAANLRDAGRSAPSAAVQTVRLALALPPGGLAVGAHEGRSSDRTPFALSILRLMLLPLRVPQNVTVGGAADPPEAAAAGGAPPLPRIERMAALRNAALAPWLGPWAADESAVDALALGVLPGLAEEEEEEEQDDADAKGGGGWGWGGRAAAKALSPPPRLGPLARPDVVAFANDAFFCAEDVLRLVAHRAPIACGFDFYSAPWQVAAAAEAGERRASQGADPAPVASKKYQQRDDDDDANELEDPAVRRDYEEDYADEELREPKPAGQEEEAETAEAAEEGATPEAPEPAAAAARRKMPRGLGAARLYDKWVSRDRLGARLSNRPPYVRDDASAKALGQGLPVAAYCCWNGLALLDAAPLGGTGAWAAAAAPERGEQAGAAARATRGGGGDAAPPAVVFRAGGHPHDCAASSECSLLCDDYRRAAAAARRGGGAPYRAVLDPAVRLAYDPAQSRALFFGGGGGERDGAPPPIPGFDVAPVDRALGPRRRWAEVAEAAAALGKTAVAPESVNCCGLRPGKNFVRFRADCAPLKWRDDVDDGAE